MSKWLVVAGLWLGTAGIAEAKKPSIDELLTAASKNSKSKKAPAAPKSAPKSAKTHAEARTFGNTMRATPVPASEAKAPTPYGGGQSTQGLVLADFAPDRHALAGP
jgi:hypothetical protein